MLIGEVARRSGVSTRMLRHYDQLGLVRPSGRTSGGYREYSADDIRRIFQVETLRSVGLSLRDVGRALDDPSFAPADPVGELIAETEQRIAREQELLQRLRSIHAQQPAEWDHVLEIVRLMHGLNHQDAGLRQRAALSVVPGDDSSVELLARAVMSEPDTNVAGAIRWALVQAGPAGLAALSGGLASTDRDVRERVVQVVAEIPGPEATALLSGALDDDDADVRRRAALALGARGDPAAAPALVDLIVAGTNDVDAADLLGRLLADPTGGADESSIVGTLVDRLSGPGSSAAQRIRLVQALAELPGDRSRRALTILSADDDRTVALTAESILGRPS